MKFFQMAWQVPGDATIVYQQNLIDVPFWSGHSISVLMQDALELSMDADFANGQLPTFYDTPGLIARKEFHLALRDLGISNLEVFPAIIRDEANNRVIDDYVLLNVIGIVSCADLDQSEYESLGDEDDPMHVIDKLVIKTDRVKGLDIFLVLEDPQLIVISERVHRHLQGYPFKDIYFERLDAA